MNAVGVFGIAVDMARCLRAGLPVALWMSTGLVMNFAVDEEAMLMTDVPHFAWFVLLIMMTEARIVVGQ